jgi:hypothetical protein
MSYYNTNKLSGKDLETAINKAKSQERQITLFMKANSDKSYTPFQLQDEFIKGYNILFPITSVRRALTNLTSDNILIKSDKMVIGDYGSSNHTWKYGGK